MALIRTIGKSDFSLNVPDGKFHVQMGGVESDATLPFSFTGSYGYSAFGNVKEYTSLTVSFTDIGLGIIYGFKKDGTYTKLLGKTTNSSPVNVTDYDFVIIELFSNATFTASVSVQ